jgi:hypothetical protein
MIVRAVTVPGRLLACDLCTFSWISISQRLPEKCPNRDCRSREWNGRKKPARAAQLVLPSPRGRGRPRIKADDVEFDLA